MNSWHDNRTDIQSWPCTIEQNLKIDQANMGGRKIANTLENRLNIANTQKN